ncbi:MAG: class IV adenylate cyclase [Bacteroidota bacterium]
MQEIEVKILEIDVATIEKRLAEIGATKEFEHEFKAIFYDFPDGRIVQNKELIRLRKEGPQSVLTHKKALPSSTVKIMEETEIEVADFEVMDQILCKMGLLRTKETHKIRAQFQFRKVHIVIDNYQGDLANIPPFLEIEASNQTELEEMVEILGFRQEHCRNWNTYDLVKHYGLS